ncbi:glial cell line-derived neurotrophic factor [Xyrauchen texanus]|uniref:glial cell line-derived neurotrophic factor n=1 Tax=Xyrauchen texanus TaxID=154827 RepID=UPI0022427E8B|nr:glial cell line-derived neurotrophic factor [Xyrauchen texanus]
MKIWSVVMLMCALMLRSASSMPLVLQNPNQAGTQTLHYTEPHRQYSQRLDLLYQDPQRKTYTSEPKDLPDHHTNKHLEPPTFSDSWATHHSGFVHRMKRSPKLRRFLHRMAVNRKRPSREERERGRGGKERGCALRQVQMKVSDLGLGYKSQEELIFSYCSGVCTNSLTNYDKILTSLMANGKKRLRNFPPTACCRPIEYDGDLSFLDDNLIYHTMERHSARKCGCV